MKLKDSVKKSISDASQKGQSLQELFHAALLKPGKSCLDNKNFMEMTKQKQEMEEIINRTNESLDLFKEVQEKSMPIEELFSVQTGVDMDGNPVVTQIGVEDYVYHLLDTKASMSQALTLALTLTLTLILTLTLTLTLALTLALALALTLTLTLTLIGYQGLYVSGANLPVGEYPGVG